MVNFSRHNQALRGWTGASEALREVESMQQMNQQAAQYQQKLNELNSQKIQEQDQRFQEAKQRTDAVIATNNRIGQDAIAIKNKYYSQIQDVLRYHNGDAQKAMNGGLYDMIEQMTTELKQTVPQELYQSLLTYNERMLDEDKREHIPQSVHDNFEQFNNDQVTNFNYDGTTLTALNHPPAEFIERYSGSKAEAYLNYQTNRDKTIANYKLEHGAPDGSQIADEDLVAYIDRNYNIEPELPKGVKGKQIVSSSHLVDKNLKDLEFMYVPGQIEQLKQTDAFKQLDSLLQSDENITTNHGLSKQFGVDATSVIGGRVLHTNDNILHEAAFGNAYQLDPDNGQAYLPAGFYNHKGLNMYDASGHKRPSGEAFEGELLVSGTYLGYVFKGTDINGMPTETLLTKDNQLAAANKKLKPVLIARMVHDADGDANKDMSETGEGKKWYKVGKWDRPDEVVFAQMDINVMTGTAWDKQLGKVSTGWNKRMAEDQAADIGRANRQRMQQMGYVNFKDITLNASPEQLSSNPGYMGMMEGYAGTMPLFQESLGKAGIDNISSNVFAHFMAASLVTENYNQSKGVLEGLTTQSVIDALSKHAGRVKEVRSSLTSNNPEDYLRYFEESAARDEGRQTASELTALVRKIAPILEQELLSIEQE